MSSMPRSTWKQFELRVAALVRGRRIAVTGQDRGDRDVDATYLHGRLHCWFQLKKRKTLRATIVDWLDEIRAVCAKQRGADGLGVLVVSCSRLKDDDALVVLRLSDWARLIERIEDGPTARVLVGERLVSSPHAKLYHFRPQPDQTVEVRLPIRPPAREGARPS